MPEIDPQKNDLLLSLSKAFIARFENVQHKQCFDLLWDISHLDQAISILDNGVQFMPDTDPKKHDFLFSLGQACLTRFENLQQTVDLDKAIDSFYRGLDLALSHNALQEEHVVGTSKAFRMRFNRTDDSSDSDHLISILELAIQTVPENDSQKLKLVRLLVLELSWHVDHFKELADIDKLVSVQTKAMELSADTDPHYLQLYLLANSQTRRFSLLKDADPVKAGALLTWGNILYLKFLQDGESIDIDTAVTSLQNALGLVTADNPDQHKYLHSLMGAYATRVDYFRTVSDIDNAIAICGEALSQTPHGHPDKLLLQSNRGICHNHRFWLLKEWHDIDNAILFHREAVELASYPEKAQYLNDLGCSLWMRYGAFGDMSDHDAGLRALSGAVEPTPKSHPEAVKLRPENHPKRNFGLLSLGKALGERYRQFHIPADRSESLSSLWQVAMSPSGTPRECQEASFRWALAPWVENQETDAWKETFDAYEVLMNLIPQVVWLGSTIREHHEALASSGDPMRFAAMSALICDRPDRAVEWLEQGRSIAWGLRMSMDELKAQEPALAEKLLQVGRSLDTASSHMGDMSRLLQDDSSEEILGQNCRHLAEEWERLVAEVRRIPGFEGFLLPKHLEHLRKASRHGPVVILYCSGPGCHALILSDGMEGVVNLQHQETLKYLHSNLYSFSNIINLL
ncbi:hypothetical protein EVG20_g11508 [Dentipellis fragilis]|uniref:CHAT domain-containing protein n=1 Tax=Dentipellis fragilis TaxID=205917 RepID=A0A4Y9XM73_9AGAM|nr:hypothetical protein EVG20_g11508 [Dentipellis fragilis]